MHLFCHCACKAQYVYLVNGWITTIWKSTLWLLLLLQRKRDPSAFISDQASFQETQLPPHNKYWPLEDLLKHLTREETPWLDSESAESERNEDTTSSPAGTITTTSPPVKRRGSTEWWLASGGQWVPQSSGQLHSSAVTTPSWELVSGQSQLSQGNQRRQIATEQAGHGVHCRRWSGCYLTWQTLCAVLTAEWLLWPLTAVFARSSVRPWSTSGIDRPLQDPLKGPRGLTFTWWGCCDLCSGHKPIDLAHSLKKISFCVYFCIYGTFDCISFRKFSRQLSAFLLCSSGLIFALLVLWNIIISL